MIEFLWKCNVNPQIRKLQYSDIGGVYDLGMKVQEFSAKDQEEYRFWSKSTLERFVSQGLSFVIEDEDSIVGFLLSAYQPITQKLTWENMYIEPAYQKRGLAEVCFKESWSKAQKDGATIVEGIVASNNLPAQKMLKRLGFSSAGDYQWMLKFG